MTFAKLSLGQRLLLITAAALAPAITILLYNEAALRAARTTEVEEQALRSGQFAALEMTRIISGSEGILKAVASAPVVRGFDRTGCLAYLRALKAQLPQFGVITVIDSSGLLRCRSEPPDDEMRFSLRPEFSKAMETKGFVVGEYAVSLINNKAVLPLVYPILGTEGEAAGIVTAGLSLDWLGRRLLERDLRRNDAITIADRKGRILARQPFPEQFVGTVIPDAFMPLVTAETPGARNVVSQDGSRRIIGYYPATANESQLYVSVGVSRDEAFGAINAATTRAVLVSALGLAIALLVSWLVGGRLVGGPVKRVTDTIRAWRAGQVSARTGMPPGGDIENIGVAIDEFMDELLVNQTARRRIEEQRDLLAEELNHRVKNLLATVQALAAQSLRGSDPEKLANFSSRLSAMAEAQKLLMASDWVSAGIGDVVASTIAPFSATGRTRFAIAGPDLVLKPKAVLALSMALHELCTNAAKYGALGVAEGCVEISWSLEPDDGGERFVMTWRETGGPEVQPPERIGFGSRMIEKVLAGEFEARVTLAYEKAGVTCRIEGPSVHVTGQGQQAPADRWAVSGLDETPTAAAAT